MVRAQKFPRVFAPSARGCSTLSVASSSMAYRRVSELRQCVVYAILFVIFMGCIEAFSEEIPFFSL